LTIERKEKQIDRKAVVYKTKVQ